MVIESENIKYFLYTLTKFSWIQETSVRRAITKFGRESYFIWNNHWYNFLSSLMAISEIGAIWWCTHMYYMSFKIRKSLFKNFAKESLPRNTVFAWEVENTFKELILLLQYKRTKTTNRESLVILNKSRDEDLIFLHFWLWRFYDKDCQDNFDNSNNEIV